MRWKRGNRLKVVSEADAPRHVRQIFDEVRHALGVPAVPFLYQAYAAYPSFLLVHWRAFRAAVESRQCFQLGTRLAAEAYTRAHNYFGVRDLRERRAWAEASPDVAPCLSLTDILDYYQYLDPLQLLIAAAQAQAFEGPVGEEQEVRAEPKHPVFLASPPLITVSEASPATHRIWDDRRRLIEIATVSDEHRALANWPDFYQGYWLALRDLVQSPLYGESQYRLAESALGLARDLPGPIETSISQLVETGLAEEEVSSLSRINDTIMQSLSGSLLDIVFARIACEGGTLGPTQPPSLKTEPSPASGETFGVPPRAA